ncbi:MAG: hypothetical protein F6K65_38015 [Moorea sp. SIO3C2]|nr:hypothetical protein [Moorena sp. SIO3C2]
MTLLGSPAEHFDFSRSFSVGESDSAGIPAHSIHPRQRKFTNLIFAIDLGQKATLSAWSRYAMLQKSR